MAGNPDSPTAGDAGLRDGRSCRQSLGKPVERARNGSGAGSAGRDGYRRGVESAAEAGVPARRYHGQSSAAAGGQRAGHARRVPAYAQSHVPGAGAGPARRHALPAGSARAVGGPPVCRVHHTLSDPARRTRVVGALSRRVCSLLQARSALALGQVRRCTRSGAMLPLGFPVPSVPDASGMRAMCADAWCHECVASQRHMLTRRRPMKPVRVCIRKLPRPVCRAGACARGAASLECVVPSHQDDDFATSTWEAGTGSMQQDVAGTDAGIGGVGMHERQAPL